MKFTRLFNNNFVVIILCQETLYPMLPSYKQGEENLKQR